ncbi:DUF1254 domain-containing protein [Methyloceanibacter caenitepidi]|uniref:DUF1254 domain-containing protein n=1 Tax=Methyloceanibacter caenitepidi TaxID=1384459 RepID=A0A0A8K645_9HYPH|nr:DUF1254 domain-containing protein [Methyloceanibacter caenitepidi]BAQ18017.1 hypothetical protein GL4_2583 [Methyloceanibacter caenitepidi]
MPGLYIALAVVLAGLIHVVAVLTLPVLAPRDAHARLAALGPTNTIIQLPPLKPGQQVMPNMAPDVRYAMCLFDLSEGPVHLRANIPDELWLIAFYTPIGENFYTVVGADMKRGNVDLVVTTGDQSVADATGDSPEALENLLVVNSPANKGIALIRAPLAGPSRSFEAQRALEAAYCGQQRATVAPPAAATPLPAPAPSGL